MMYGIGHWWIVVLLQLFSMLADAQASRPDSVGLKTLRDSLRPKEMLRDSVPSKRRFLRSSGEFLLTEIGPYLFDRYVTQQDYARISWQTTGHNLNPASWEWDYDGFQTNQIGHPYHGSILFNSFRSNGYSFWQSVPAVFAGSYLWETFAENQPPAPNDFINTGFGGVILGEATHRLAGKLLNNGSRGLRRQAAEMLAFLINPTNGFNRILDAKWGKPGWGQQDDASLKLGFEAGFRRYDGIGGHLFNDGRYGFYGRFRLEYGDPALHPSVPFSHFFVVLEGGQDDSSVINVVTVHGSLKGWVLRSGASSEIAAISGNYDYIRNSAFMYSAQSIRMNLFSHFSLGGVAGLSTAVGAGPIILAAVPNSYLFHTRNYDYGPGVAVSGEASILIGTHYSGTISYRGGWMRTVNGNATDYYVHVITGNVSVRLIDRYSLGGEFGYFALHGNYIHFNTIDKKYPYLRLSIRFDQIIP